MLTTLSSKSFAPVRCMSVTTRIPASSKPQYGEVKNFHCNKLVSSKTKNWLPVRNPSNNEILGEVPLSTKEEMNEIIAKAHEGFRIWRDTPILTRIKKILEYRNRLMEYQDHITEIVKTEIGKQHKDALGEMIRGIEMCEMACSAPFEMAGHTIENISTGIDLGTIYQPMGVAAAICPFNFPAMIPLWTMPFALATGCSFLLKPAEVDPYSAQMLVALTEGIFPDGVVQMMNGSVETCEMICDHPLVKTISFVGSTRIGSIIHRRGTDNGKRVQCNMAAKNHGVIMPDAHKDRTLDLLIGACFGASGQRCMALPVAVFVGQAKKWIPELVARAKTVHAGPPSDDKAALGPVITQQSKDRILAAVKQGVKEGAKLLLDGTNPKPIPGHEEGYFINPTILGDCKPHMKCYTEELFGPVMNIMTVDTLDEAIKLINECPYGNGTAIFTRSGAAARKFNREVSVGQVGINVPIPVPLAFMSFSGSRLSHRGHSHYYGRDQFKFFTQVKTTTTQWFDDDVSAGIKAASAFPVHGK